ncbi:conserved oligomeric Golgi complex subunit 2-like isoform X2 [Mustela putorius furo]|uniref:Conserved oligomeric Golgi complex subunit 2 n=1 Tax=Mustela putorius furo TaxID=9669 RepID=A0A8U0RHF1_MUSPF|nr:conserved oligomeric Golgi complex subunit 2-like isoform X2 [Mustela putorius furo]
MVDLINKDYADFVNLSTNLVGMDKALNELSVPLGQLREVLVIVEQIVESHPDGLKIMYANKLLEFVPHHCRLLREVTGGAISSPQLSHLPRALQPS